MKYLIDTASQAEIDKALKLGVSGITANPSMYKKENISVIDFVKKYAHLANENDFFLSGEILSDSLDVMLKQAKSLLEINNNIVIKINFSPLGLQACKILSSKGYNCAMTLIFSVYQAIAAINAGAKYIFPFVGRTENYGLDGLKLISDVKSIAQKYDVNVVAASIKNIYQLEELAKLGADYAAIPFSLYEQSLYHPLTEQGEKTFINDWKFK